MVLSSIPPSTSISKFSWLTSRRTTSSRILSMVSGRKAWPPKPGLTVITRTWSTKFKTFLTASTGVPGLITTLGLTPAARIFCSAPWICGVASAWMLMISAPARANSSIWCSGLETIRWQSKTSLLWGRILATTPAPKLILGTKWPSIISIWAYSAPVASNFFSSDSKLA